jgi:putative oxidoreductase
MPVNSSEPAKLIPALAWYRPFEPFALAYIRFCAGALIVPHGIDRLFFSGVNRELGLLGGVSSLAGAVELIGGLLLAVGLFTRPAALLLAIEWAIVAAAVPVRPGQSWMLLGGTPHHPAYLAAICFAFIFAGGGRYSIDRLLGREL